MVGKQSTHDLLVLYQIRAEIPALVLVLAAEDEMA